MTIDKKSDNEELSQAIETEALCELHRSAPPTLRESMGLRLESVDGATVSVAARGANIVINRVIGLGTNAPANGRQLDTIRNIYADADVNRYFIHAASSARPAPLTAFLENAGFVADRPWMKFVRDGGAVEEPSRDLEIREIDAEHAGDFGRIAGSAFGLGGSARELLAALVGRPGWRIFMSFDAGRPAGTGALFVRGSVGWTDWGATDPAFRRRGSQSALLARRVNAAADMGCTLLCTCTGEAVDGEDQHSYRNILRAGFVQAGLRPNYSPAGRPA
ncbi:MAG: GNAT family N-acetyltransferase [Gammaproteobacteria bacterium]|jgi:GNAT superfamily N-acetyltransferase